MGTENVTEFGLDQHLNSELIEIARALRGLRFGTVVVVVQDGLVVQIDRTEKRRVRGRGDLPTRRA